MVKQLLNLLLIVCCIPALEAQTPLPIKQLLKAPYMQGATFSLMVKEVADGSVLYSYDAGREVTPASVMKLVTTATALELIGADYRYPTTLEYDGEIGNGILRGNLYIRGSGDPTLGSSHFASDRSSYTPSRNTFIPEWIAALRKAGIGKIEGAVIADESIFDTEGISLKWVGEDLGSYYGAGSYGLSVFDNLYKLFFQTGAPGGRPRIVGSEPNISSSVRFHNYLRSAAVASDSSFITGAPFAPDRYIYGVVPSNREQYVLKGDIPDPALFLSQYLTTELNKAGISVASPPSCYRIESEAGTWQTGERREIATTYSPTLKEIVRVANEVSHNLFADALIKTIGLQYEPRRGEVVSSFNRGIEVLRRHWLKKGLDVSPLWMYDGSGLAATGKVSAAFVADLLCYMATASEASTAFNASLPQAGIEGSVRNFLKGTALQGKARIKSGSMSRVKGYAGYVDWQGKRYAVALFANNYACDGRQMTQALEGLLKRLFE